MRRSRRDESWGLVGRASPILARNLERRQRQEDPAPAHPERLAPVAPTLRQSLP